MLAAIVISAYFVGAALIIQQGEQAKQQPRKARRIRRTRC